MYPLTLDAQRRLERALRDALSGAEVIASSVTVDRTGEVSIDEMVLRLDTGAAWAVNIDSQEERLVLSRYSGPGGWSPTGPQDWVEVTADDLTEEGS